MTTTHVVVMGVAGCGKTTVAQLLSDQMGWILIEGDDYHPQANIDKMARGIPLTDADRWPWLDTLANWMAQQEDAGKSSILTCSALKRKYRDRLRSGVPDVRFIHLDGSEELLAQRMRERTGHFMPPSLLPSQLATLERLMPDENGVVIDIDTTPEHIAAAAVQWLRGPSSTSTTRGSA
ncbi:gluconokinase [Actinomycetaceae bacterium WB03_NA08]|uniref:Gluconokinase n=1 Tax=Scrofimicrobium canadense TaxID=2652290 RepID=A0A6N7W4K9_9ACTO|nr:gluconokinase [Scrofimicrobium canadense]MSS84351.1 gluconokinase [Scrofimicrobium canadense]